VPEDLIELWVGHAPATVSDGYSKLKEYVESGAFTAEQAGLGYKLPEFAAAPKTRRAEVALTA